MRRMIDIGNPMGSELNGKSRKIPEHEMNITVARSGGPGGQGVNTAESKAVLRWHIGNSSAFSTEEKSRIRERASNVTVTDEIVLHCSELRTQLANKKACVDRLHEMVNQAIVVEEERRETKKSKGVRARELDSKTKNKRKKQQRRGVDSD